MLINIVNCTVKNNMYLVEDDIKINVRISDFKTPSCSAIVYFIKGMRRAALHDPLPICLSKSISYPIAR